MYSKLYNEHTILKVFPMIDDKYDITLLLLPVLVKPVRATL